MYRTLKGTVQAGEEFYLRNLPPFKVSSINAEGWVTGTFVNGVGGQVPEASYQVDVLLKQGFKRGDLIGKKTKGRPKAIGYVKSVNGDMVTYTDSAGNGPFEINWDQAKRIIKKAE